MSDDLTPPTGTIKFDGYPPTTIIGEDARWTLPPADQIAKMRPKALCELIHAYIEHAERGDAQNRLGSVVLAIVRAQYLGDQLARRSQNRQTRWIIAMTAVITIMTAAIMVATIPWGEWWDWLGSAIHSLPARAP